MAKKASTKQYDLEDRTLTFAKNCRRFVKQLPRTLAAIEDSKQLAKSSGSVGANYIEANEALSKKDFRMRIKLCRKEAKESRYWLNPTETDDCSDAEAIRCSLIQEATELMNIFSAIHHNSE